METQLTKQPNAESAALIFTPPPDTISEILGMLGDADTLLSDIAEKFHTTLEALTLWMAQDDIIQRMATLQAAIAARVRLIATAALPKATEALTLMIGEYTHEANHVPTNHGSLKAIHTRHRSRDLTRKAISLLHRLTNFGSAFSGSGLGFQPKIRAHRPKVLPPQSPELSTTHNHPETSLSSSLPASSSTSAFASSPAAGERPLPEAQRGSASKPLVSTSVLFSPAPRADDPLHHRNGHTTIAHSP